jgi:flavin reductase (DIM6/NTAB) family NADH-FMN oxidoreductase RutF
VSSFSVLRASDDFAISVLARHQRDVARVFSTRSSRRFARIDWRRDITGSPIIDGAAAWFDCRVHSRRDVGDHLIVVGEVLAFGHRGTPPLGYLRGDYVEASRIDGPTKTKVPSPVWELHCMTGFGA